MRAATLADLPAIAELQHRWETAWFGSPEQDADEIQESFDRAEQSRVLIVDARIVAAAWWSGTESTLIVHPDADTASIYNDLLPWFASSPGVVVESLSQDEALRGALGHHGWRHLHSTFELIRPVTPDWVIAEPVWPEGVTVRDYRTDDASAVHRLIYVDAAWSEVTGHHERDLEEWRGIFVTKHTLPEQQVLAWRGDRLIGVAMGRTFSDVTGWVAQLAVAKDERGQGLGRALLLDALRRRRHGGATAVGLSVNEANRGALDLYLGVGLEIDREFMEFAAPDQ